MRNSELRKELQRNLYLKQKKEPMKDTEKKQRGDKTAITHKVNYSTFTNLSVEHIPYFTKFTGL